MIAIHDEARGFVGAVGVNDAAHLDAGFLGADLMALIGDDADRMAADAGVGGDERFAVIGLVFIERIRIDDRGEKIARVVGFLTFETDQIVNRIRIFRRMSRVFLRAIFFRGLGFRQMGDERTQPLQARRIILLIEINRAADFGVHVRAAEFFGIDDLSDGGFDQRRAGEIKTAAFGHENLVAKHRQIGAAGDAVAHDGGELRNARRGR